MKYHQGKYKPRNPEKYVGSHPIVYRSSYEKKAFIKCDLNPQIVEWASESTIVPYISPIDGKYHRYYVDLTLKLKTSQGMKIFLIEIKPAVQTRPPKQPKRKTKRYLNEVKTWSVNEAKWKAAEAYCKKKGWQFAIFTEKELNIKR